MAVVRGRRPDRATQLFEIICLRRNGAHFTLFPSITIVFVILNLRDNYFRSFFFFTPNLDLSRDDLDMSR
jgi:hypothetical protein